MPRSTLVIGGTRNLGPDLVAALVARGDRVTVLNRGVTRADLPREVLRLRADRSDAAALEVALRGRAFDLVVDTTLYAGPDAKAAARVLDGRVGRYVFWSTGQVYLVRTGLTAPFGEDDYDGPVMVEPPTSSTIDHDNWRYGVDKRAAEDALRTAFRSHAFPFVSLRMPMINSPRDHYTRLAAYVHRLLDGGPILIPDDQDALRLRHVFGGDVVKATLRAGEPGVPAGSCLNIAQDETLTLEEMLAPVGRQLGRAVVLKPVPRAELERRGLLPGCSPWSGRWMSVLANERARQVLGLRFMPPAEYLPALVETARALPASQVVGYQQRPREADVAS
ncbi:MAG: NAD-dependent epimerase/dehydratase family protein [Gemmatimonadales bacterium]